MSQDSSLLPFIEGPQWGFLTGGTLVYASSAQMKVCEWTSETARQVRQDRSMADIEITGFDTILNSDDDPIDENTRVQAEWDCRGSRWLVISTNCLAETGDLPG